MLAEITSSRSQWRPEAPTFQLSQAYYDAKVEGPQVDPRYMVGLNLSWLSAQGPSVALSVVGNGRIDSTTGRTLGIADCHKSCSEQAPLTVSQHCHLSGFLYLYTASGLWPPVRNLLRDMKRGGLLVSSRFVQSDPFLGHRDPVCVHSSFQRGIR